MSANGAKAQQSAEEAKEPVDTECFYGVIKSYNERRGFGFVVCEETARRYGRDVYISKEEAVALSKEPAIGAAAAEPVVEEKGPPVKEGDYLMFQVQKSTEGFPQAVRARKFRRLRGVVSQAPVKKAGSFVDGTIVVQGDEADRGVKPGPGLDRLLGADVRVSQVDCGQLRLHVGDEVAFCCTSAEESQAGAHKPAFEAKLVELLSTKRGSGAFLGCFLLELPRTAAPDADEKEKQRLEGNVAILDGHALSNRIVLAGLPYDLGVPELMRLFGKLGATEGVVTFPEGRDDAAGYASLTFSGPEGVGRFLARTGHTISDQGATRIAYIRQHRRSIDGARPCLPALPTPILSFPEQDVLLVKWSQVSLAAGYLVELRPAGQDGPWRAVTAATGALEDNEDLPKGLLGPTCSSCRVTDVKSGVAYEARVSYYSPGGCKSEADIAHIGDHPAGASTATKAATPEKAPAAAVGSKPDIAAPPSRVAGSAVPPRPPASAAPTTIPSHCAQPQHGVSAIPGVGLPPPPEWRCPCGNLTPAAAAPEMVPCSEDGRSICIRWPVVIHATAYTVELFEDGTQASERFTRAVPEAMTEALVELRVGNLQPGAYHACVRCIAPCGCESVPSPWSFMQPTWAPAVPPPMPYGLPPPGAFPGWKDFELLQQPLRHDHLAHLAPPPPYRPIDAAPLGVSAPPAYPAMSISAPATSPPGVSPSLDALVLD
eukprot:TRINITY_DN73813_c0_g1_i1.p1 TRINITY_DN73813_c0_g1~~TRINITY_DN73813_c0_g1_i1.p1  ORF type:complete len:714 (-),score=94.06 TRINITY_DN73813_c0_g1_i1:99-2240(-)